MASDLTRVHTMDIWLLSWLGSKKFAPSRSGAPKLLTARMSLAVNLARPGQARRVAAFSDKLAVSQFCPDAELVWRALRPPHAIPLAQGHPTGRLACAPMGERVAFADRAQQASRKFAPTNRVVGDGRTLAGCSQRALVPLANAQDNFAASERAAKGNGKAGGAAGGRFWCERANERMSERKSERTNRRRQNKNRRTQKQRPMPIYLQQLLMKVLPGSHIVGQERRFETL